MLEEEKVPPLKKTNDEAEDLRTDNENLEAIQNDEAGDKYYKKFDFFYKRTCFRLMAEYYKLTFQPYQK